MELPEAVTARAREEDEFRQAVSQHETMKMRQAEVCFERHPGKRGEHMRNEGLS